jgi:hypothetical protein
VYAALSFLGVRDLEMRCCVSICTHTQKDALLRLYLQLCTAKASTFVLRHTKTKANVDPVHRAAPQVSVFVHLYQ